MDLKTATALRIELNPEQHFLQGHLFRMRTRSLSQFLAHLLLGLLPIFLACYAQSATMKLYSTDRLIGTDEREPIQSCPAIREHSANHAGEVSALVRLGEELFRAFRISDSAARQEKIASVVTELEQQAAVLKNSSSALKDIETVDRDVQFKWRLPAFLQFVLVGSTTSLELDSIHLPTQLWRKDYGTPESSIVHLEQRPLLREAKEITLKTKMSGLHACLTEIPVEAEATLQVLKGSREKTYRLLLTSKRDGPEAVADEESQNEFVQEVLSPIVDRLFQPISPDNCDSVLRVFANNPLIISRIRGSDTYGGGQKYQRILKHQMWRYIGTAVSMGSSRISRAEIEHKSNARFRKQNMRVTFERACRDGKYIPSCQQPRVIVDVPLVERLSLSDPGNWLRLTLRPDSALGAVIEDWSTQGISVLQMQISESSQKDWSSIQSRIEELFKNLCQSN